MMGRVGITPRDLVHIRHCKALKCIVEHDDGADEACHSFEALLDQVEDYTRHQEARRFDALIDSGMPRVIEPGVGHMVRELEPYDKADAFDPELHDVHPSEFSDCSECARGVGHWHYKGTQQPVLWKF